VVHFSGNSGHQSLQNIQRHRVNKVTPDKVMLVIGFSVRDRVYGLGFRDRALWFRDRMRFSVSIRG